MKNGDYELVVAPDDYPGMRYRGRYAYEHHVVWWRIKGELPPDGYVVHHKNGDHRDNKPDNLEMKTVEEHNSLHSAAKRKPGVPVTCAWCSTVFTIRGRNKKFKEGIGQSRFYCCRSHAVLMQQKERREKIALHTV